MKKKLQELFLDDFQKFKSWRTIDEDYDIEPFLEPATYTSSGELSQENGGCWCLCEAVFKNKTKWFAVARCEGYSNDPPMLWSVWNHEDFIPLEVPPVPDFILEKKGPEWFSMKFSCSTEEIFPLEITAVDVFELEPKSRKVIIDTTGVV
jgi:hypothetical protein